MGNPVVLLEWTLAVSNHCVILNYAVAVAATAAAPVPLQLP